MDEFFARKLFGNFPQHNITHLELLGYSGTMHQDAGERALAALPHLTHLALHDTDSMLICDQLLETCKSLCSLIVHVSTTQLRYSTLSLAKVPRFVVMTLSESAEDWQRGALMGRDFWARADAFIAARISGEIDRESLLNFEARKLTALLISLSAYLLPAGCHEMNCLLAVPLTSGGSMSQWLCPLLSVPSFAMASIWPAYLNTFLK
jgi:hypothetical protein